MLIPAATPELYNTALDKYFARLNTWEHNFKVKTTYLNNAIYKPCIFNPENNFYRNICKNVYIVFSNNIEYGLCHTLENIIVIVGNIPPENLNYIIKHELIHIFLRYNKNNINLIKLRDKLGLIKILRRPVLGEITNPDTYDYEGLIIKNKIIFIALTHNNNKYKKIYYTYYINNKYLRISNYTEIKYYNNTLPYLQNYHSEEIFAYIISN